MSRSEDQGALSPKRHGGLPNGITDPPQCDASSATREGCPACRRAYLTCEFDKDPILTATAAQRSSQSPPLSVRHKASRIPRPSSPQTVPPAKRSRNHLSATPARKELFPHDECGNVRYLGPTAGYSFVASVQDYFTLMGYESIALPPKWRWANPPSLAAPLVHFALPSRQAVSELLESFRTSFHTWFPVVSWPTLEVKISKVYALLSGSVVDVAGARLSFCLINAILAIGSQFAKLTDSSSSPDAPRALDGKEFFECALHAYQWCPANYTYDDIVFLLLMSCYLERAGSAGPCYMFAGAAFRIAADMGLDKVGPSALFTASDDHLRKRLFRACFVLDSRLALTFGRPPFFSHSNLDTDRLLTPTEEANDPEPGGRAGKQESQSQRFLLVMAMFSREVEGIIENQMNDDICAQVIAADKRLADAWNLLDPEHRSINPEQPLEPALLNILLYLQHVRLVLHRYFSDPSVTDEVRAHCFRRCAEICVESSQIVLRTTHWPETEQRLGDVTTDVVENHIFRCSILLLMTIFNHRHGLHPRETSARVKHLRTMVMTMKKLANSGRVHSARSLPQVLQLAENIALYESEVLSLTLVGFPEFLRLLSLRSIKPKNKSSTILQDLPDEPDEAPIGGYNDMTHASTDQTEPGIDPYGLIDWSNEPMQEFQGHMIFQPIS